MLKQLSGLDASFLYLETGRSFGHVSSILIFDRPADDPGFDPCTVYRRRIERDIGDYEPMRRRLVEVPFGIDHPYWALDPEFDLDFHIRHIAVPPPGGHAELNDLVSHLIGRPLDRSKPLWETYVIDSLADDRFAIFTKMHHSTIDGAAGAMLTQQLLTPDALTDARPDPAPEPVDLPTIPPPVEVFGRALFDLARRPQRMWKFQRRLARELLRVGRSPEKRRELLSGVPGVPRTPFNASITPHRRFSWRAVPLARVKEIKSALGVTLNDVVVAMSAGAVRTYLQEKNALPDEPLVAMIPVSIRTGDEEDAWTNRVSSIFVKLPTDLDDPRARVEAMSDTMADGKKRFDLLPADLIVDAASLAPGRLALEAARLATNPRVADNVPQPANLVISNVPGPRDQLMLGAAPLRHYVPVSTVVDGQGLNITVQSYRDTLDIGLVSCRELVPDLDHLVDLHVEALDEIAVRAGIDAAAPTR